MLVTKPKKKTTRKRRAPSPFREEILDEILGNYQKPDDLIGEDGVLKQLMGALINRAMDAEMEHHLGYPSNSEPPPEQSNRRNGKSGKTVRTNVGDVEIEIPRDREGDFEPQLVAKHDRHFSGFDDKILSMYARGMSVRDIQGHLKEIYGVDVSPELVSRATDAIVDELKIWRERPLEPVYMIIYIDGLVVKTREKGRVENRTVYNVVGVGADGRKDVLGLWMEATEGAKYWLAILEELKQRGVRDIFILCADGLSGIAQATETAFPKAIFQTCIVHMIRSSVRYVPWKDRKAVCRDLREIYTAIDAEAALAALERLDEKWGKKFPLVAKSWRRRWDEVTPFLSYPAEIRKAVYTTNAVEALNRQIRKTLKTKGHMPNDDAALKLIYLTIRNAQKKWGGRTRDWTTALNQFAIYFEERMPNLN